MYVYARPANFVKKLTFVLGVDKVGFSCYNKEKRKGKRKMIVKENLEYFFEVINESICNFFCQLWNTLTDPLERRFKRWVASKTLSPSHFKCYQILDWANYCPTYGNSFTLTELKEHFGTEYEQEINWCICKKFLIDYTEENGQKKFMFGLAPLLDEEFGKFFGW